MTLYAGQRFKQDSLPFRGIYAFGGRTQANIPIPTSTWTTIAPFIDNMDEDDPDGWYDHAGNITTKERCLALVQWQVRFGTSSTGNRGIQVHKNGQRSHIYVGTPAPTGVTIFNLFYQTMCEPGDVLTLLAWQNTGADLNVEASSARDTRFGFLGLVLP